MTDQQTANRILEKVKFKSKDKAEIWALREAQDALIKRSPTKVRYEGTACYDGSIVYDLAYCPSCDTEIEDCDITWNCSFCPSCGQALDWEAEESEE